MNHSPPRRRHPKQGRNCAEGPEHWRVMERNCHHSAFAGGHRTSSPYSQLMCVKCRTVWRSAGKYVRGLPDINERERAEWLRPTTT